MRNTKMSAFPMLPTPGVRPAAIHLPSGENDGERYWTFPPRAWVSCRKPLPSGAAVYRLAETLCGPSRFE